MKNILFSVCLLISAICCAQNAPVLTLVINGEVRDSLSREAVPYATIRISKKSDPGKVVKVDATNLNGQFSERIPFIKGNYVLAISSVGKETVTKIIVVTNSGKNINIGTILMSDAANKIKGVEVVAQKPLVKADIDKLTYDIESDPDSKTNTVLDMLRKVPLVTVDGDDNIKVKGNGNFKVYINGKPNNMISNNPSQVLKSMPASSIKSVEVITNPGAKYDAEGVGGIINIVTVKQGIEGYTATVNTGIDNRRDMFGGFVTVKKGKLTVSTNYNLNKFNNPANTSSSRQENYASSDQKYLNTDGRGKYKGLFQYGNMEASYDIDSLRLISVSLGMYGASYKNNSDSQTGMFSQALDTCYSYMSLSNSKNSFYSVDGSVDYQRLYKVKDRRLTISYKINTNPSTSNLYSVYDNKRQVPESLNLYDRHTKGETNTTESTFQTDYSTPLGKIHTIDVGAKYILRNNVSDNKYYSTSSSDNEYKYVESKSSHYKNLNDILSAYASYTLKYKKISFRPGVRYEFTIQKVKYLVGNGSNFTSHLNDIVPSVTFGYSLSQMQNILLGYNMRIWRPNIEQLNPYFDDQDPMNISQGNSKLKSEKNHAFNLTYSNFNSKVNINLSLDYSFNNNGIENVTSLIPTSQTIDGHSVSAGALYTTYQNIGKSQNSGLNSYVNWNISSTTRVNINASGSYQDIKSPQQSLHNYGWNGSIFGGIQQTFPWKIRFSMNGGGMTPSITLQGRSTGFHYYGFNLNKTFMKDRLTLSLFANNIFDPHINYNSHKTGTNFSNWSYYRYSSLRYGFNLSYRFGELKAAVKKAITSISNDDVKAGKSDSTKGN